MGLMAEANQSYKIEVKALFEEQHEEPMKQHPALK